jgi:flagellar protein FlgJ
MDARQLLKGGGQITDFEGKKAENGIARMQRAQSPEEFKKGAIEYQEAVRAGVAKLRKKANVSNSASEPKRTVKFSEM